LAGTVPPIAPEPHRNVRGNKVSSPRCHSSPGEMPDHPRAGLLLRRKRFACTPNPIPECVVPASQRKPDNCSRADSPWESQQVPPAARPSLPCAPSTSKEWQRVAMHRQVICVSSSLLLEARQDETSAILVAGTQCRPRWAVLNGLGNRCLLHCALRQSAPQCVLSSHRRCLGSKCYFRNSRHSDSVLPCNCKTAQEWAS
jgi:hypothetical protein